MKILNTIHEDYHMHSINYSDGINTIDEIVQYADKVGLKKITITDHSQYLLDKANIPFRNRRTTTKRRKNIHNDIEVTFGVEGDLINENGDCCFDIQGHESDFSILACHPETYQGNRENITQAYINAINKYQNKIKFIAHISNLSTSKYLDIKLLTKHLNQNKIPIEFNCAYMDKERGNMQMLDNILHLIEGGVYVNSDMHTLNDFNLRQVGFDYLKKLGYS